MNEWNGMEWDGIHRSRANITFIFNLFCPDISPDVYMSQSYDGRSSVKHG